MEKILIANVKDKLTFGIEGTDDYRFSDDYIALNLNMPIGVYRDYLKLNFNSFEYHRKNYFHNEIDANAALNWINKILNNKRGNKHAKTQC